MDNLVRDICGAVSSAPSYCPMQYIVQFGRLGSFRFGTRYFAYVLAMEILEA